MTIQILQQMPRQGLINYLVGEGLLAVGEHHSLTTEELRQRAIQHVRRRGY